MESEPAPALYFKQVLAGPMQNFVYLIGDPRTREAAIVDAAWDVGRILDIAKEDGQSSTTERRAWPWRRPTVPGFVPCPTPRPTRTTEGSPLNQTPPP